MLLKPSVKKKRHNLTKMLFHSRCGSGRQLFLDSWLDILIQMWKRIGFCWCLITSKSFNVFLSFYQINYILFHSDIYSKVRHLAFEKHWHILKTPLQTGLSAFWMMKQWYFFYPKWIHFISSWEKLGDCVVLLVEGCSLIQCVMKCNWIPLGEFASFWQLFKYSL